MDVYSPYERVSLDDVKPSDIVLLLVDGKFSLSMACLTDRGETGFLILEGERAGQIDFPAGGKVMRFKEPIRLELPRDSSGWLTGNRPDAPLVVAIDGEDTYFTYVMYGQHVVALDVKSGRITNPPFRPFYLTKWAAYSEGSKLPFLEGGI